MRRFQVAILFAVLAPAVGLGRPGKQSWENLNQLGVGQKIEVVDMNSGSLNGTFLGFSEEAISLRVGVGEVAVPRAKVLRVRLRQPKRLRNAVIGAAIGVGVGLAIAIPVWIVGEGAGAFPGILGPIVGGGAGAGVGAAVPLGSRTIYKAKRIRGAKAR